MFTLAAQLIKQGSLSRAFNCSTIGKMIIKGIIVSIIQCIFLLTGEVECVRSREVYPPVNASDGMEHLYFGLMMSLGGAQDSSGMVPAVQVALDLINNSSLLTGYTLHYVLYDSKVGVVREI